MPRNYKKITARTAAVPSRFEISTLAIAGHSFLLKFSNTCGQTVSKHSEPEDGVSKLLDPEDIFDLLQNARPRGYFSNGARSVFIYGGYYQTSLLPVASPSLFVFATNFCIIAPAGRPHLVKFYFSTGRPERRVYILVPDLHGVHSSNNLVHSSNNSTKLLLPGARKPICGTVGSQTRPPCSRCCWPSWPAQ